MTDVTTQPQPVTIPENRILYGYQPRKKRNAPLLLLFQILLPFALSILMQLFSNILATVIFMLSDPKWMTAFTNYSDTKAYLAAMNEFQTALLTSPVLYISMFFGYVLLIAIYLLIVWIAGKKTSGSIGLSFGSPEKRRKACLSYLRGLLIGGVMMTAVFGLLLLTGQSRVTAFGISSAALPVFLANIAMWFPQGATEEIMTRGYMMSRLSPRFGKAVAVAITSALFSVMHMGNQGVNPVALLNLVLIAVFFAVLCMHTNELWTVCAVHAIWNLTQGNIFGFEVSGNVTPASVLTTSPVSGASDLLTGGAFGPEGGLFVTAVTVLALAILVFLMKKGSVKNG